MLLLDQENLHYLLVLMLFRFDVLQDHLLELFALRLEVFLFQVLLLDGQQVLLAVLLVTHHFEPVNRHFLMALHQQLLGYLR